MYLRLFILTFFVGIFLPCLDASGADGQSICAFPDFLAGHCYYKSRVAGNRSLLDLLRDECHYEDMKAGSCAVRQRDRPRYRSAFETSSCRAAAKKMGYPPGDCNLKPNSKPKPKPKAKAALPTSLLHNAAADLEPAPSAAGRTTGTASLVTNADQLRDAKRFWEDQVFYCKSGKVIYPSKNDSGFNPLLRYDRRIPKSVWENDYVSSEHCDDGDMVFFGGLLCLAGDNRGCALVASSQDKSSGRWWRSPRLIGEPDTSGHASFSTEQGLGVYNYTIQTGDKDAFKRWLDWIDANPRIYAPLPSYCTHKECVFKAIDCPLLVAIAARFDLAVRASSVCSPLRALDIPGPDQLEDGLQRAMGEVLKAVASYEDVRNKLVGQLGKLLGVDGLDKLLPRPTKDLQEQIGDVMKAYADAREKVLGPQIGEAAAQLAQSIVLLNSVINGVEIKDSSFKFDAGKLVFKSDSVTLDGANVSADLGKLTYNSNGEHIAAVEVFMLRNLGYGSPVLDTAANIILQRDEDNPFFEYLAHGRSARMLDLIIRKCPSRQRPSTVRFQWFPERGEENQGQTNQPAWAESMYWDCLFLSELYDRDTSPALARTRSDPLSSLAGALGEALNLLATLRNTTEALDRNIEDMDKQLKNALPGIGDYCRHNQCPPVIPTIPSTVVSGFCRHNWCP